LDGHLMRMHALGDALQQHCMAIEQVNHDSSDKVTRDLSLFF
jgi:hypothetical protein